MIAQHAPTLGGRGSPPGHAEVHGRVGVQLRLHHRCDRGPPRGARRVRDAVAGHRDGRRGGRQLRHPAGVGVSRPDGPLGTSAGRDARDVSCVPGARVPRSSSPSTSAWTSTTSSPPGRPCASRPSASSACTARSSSGAGGARPPPRRRPWSAATRPAGPEPRHRATSGGRSTPSPRRFLRVSGVDYPPADPPSATKGPRCRVGTSPTSGKSSPSRSPTRRRRSTATGASPGPSSTGGPTASPPRCSTGAPPSRTRSPSTSTTAPSTSSRCSARSRPGSCPSTPTTATQDDELVYLWDNADAWRSSSTARFTGTIERIRDRVPKVTTWLWVDDGDGAVPRVGHALRGGRRQPRRRRVVAPWGRSGDHLYMLYTGGTTGMPKGVMWRQDDLFRDLVGARSNPLLPRGPRPTSTMVRETGHRAGPGRPAGLPAHARHRAASPSSSSCRWAAPASPSTSPAPRRRRAARHHRARAGQPDRHRGRRLRQADAPGARRRTPAAGTWPACSWSRRRA